MPKNRYCFQRKACAHHLPRPHRQPLDERHRRAAQEHQEAEAADRRNDN